MHKCTKFDFMGNYWHCQDCGRSVKAELIPETIARIDKILSKIGQHQRLNEIKSDLQKLVNN